MNFFDGGLRFACIGCGDCCRGPGTVYVGAHERGRLASALGVDLDTLTSVWLVPFRDAYRLVDASDGSCVLLGSDGRCTAYGARPQQCRSFPFWLENLRNPERWRAAAARCPGIGQGELHDASEILVALDESPI